ncbi:MAG: hypothetical protein Ct9H300mP20_08500 [Gammaproteobacteria bacterium]|nr:MAG: hypothetical protein Ct9H300mP20_08500 [Gammaproteobacteria bacterium]
MDLDLLDQPTYKEFRGIFEKEGLFQEDFKK